MVVVNRIHSSLTFSNGGVASKAQLKTVVVKLFNGAFEDLAVTNGFIIHPPSTVSSIIVRAKQLAIYGCVNPFDLLLDKVAH